MGGISAHAVTSRSRRVVTVVWALLETIRWKYTITNRRVFVRHGLVSVQEQTARLERVQDVTLRQTLFDRLFGVGRLDIDTAGSEGGALEFKALTEPTHVREVWTPQSAGAATGIKIRESPSGD